MMNWKRIAVLAGLTPLLAAGPFDSARAEGFTYQGRLFEGATPANGSYDIRFGLYAWDYGGWPVTDLVTNVGVWVTNGLFSTVVDFGDTPFGRAPYALEVAVIPNGSESEFTPLEPRQWITPAPTAMYATKAGALSDPSFIGTTLNSALVLSLNNTPALRLNPGSSIGLLVGADYNIISMGAVGAAITGGGSETQPNTVSDDFGTVSGGLGNRAGSPADDRTRQAYATVGGGLQNVAGGLAAVVSGGRSNLSDGLASVVGGGSANAASQSYATIAGGSANAASGHGSTIGGGELNTNLARFATIAGGSGHLAGGQGGTVAGGVGHANAGDYGTIGGGLSNVIASTVGGLASGVIAGGRRHYVSGVYAVVSGGNVNTNTAAGGVIAGGILNLQAGDYSVIAGGGQHVNRGSYASIGGGFQNTNGGGYATIAGGIRNTNVGNHASIGGGQQNLTTGAYATIGGGSVNTATNNFATVSGGAYNIGGGPYSSVGGGQYNAALGFGSTVAGGMQNTAQGDYSFAAGRKAGAYHTGTFVWGDSTPANLYSAGSNQFVVRASGGVWFGTNSTVSFRPDEFIATSTGAYLSQGGAWTDSSDRHAKENFAPVDRQRVLEAVARLPISSWNYRAESDDVRHIGPVAQDFHAAFGVGSDDRHIAPLDSTGVALAAIQALHQSLKERDARLQSLEAEVTELKAILRGFTPPLKSTDPSR